MKFGSVDCAEPVAKSLAEEGEFARSFTDVKPFGDIHV